MIRAKVWNDPGSVFSIHFHPAPLASFLSTNECGANAQTRQGALKGTNLRGHTEPKRRFSQILADFCRFSPFLRKQSIWETQISAENRRLSLKRGPTECLHKSGWQWPCAQERQHSSLGSTDAFGRELAGVARPRLRQRCQMSRCKLSDLTE